MNKLPYFLFFLFSLLTASNFAQGFSECPNESCLEGLHFDSVRLSSKIPLMLEDEELVNFLGRPDSIVVEDDWHCGNYLSGDETVRILYYGKTKFMSSQGTSMLYVLNFEEKRFTFDFGNEQLKHGTSKADLQKIFPNALNSLNKKLQSYNEKGRMKVKMIQTPEFEDSSGWMFTFNGQKIKEIELWWFIC